ncbi:hypothetical protein Tco_0561496 [Tanacetum coccineum]
MSGNYYVVANMLEILAGLIVHLRIKIGLNYLICVESCLPLQMSQLQFESIVAWSLLAEKETEIQGMRDAQSQQSQLCKQPQEGKEVPILHGFRIGSNYLDIKLDELFRQSLKTSREAAKYVANGGIIRVVSTATYELFVLNFGLGLISDLKADPSQMIDIHSICPKMGMESEHNYLQYLTHFTASDTPNGRVAPVVVNFARGYFGFEIRWPKDKK